MAVAPIFYPDKDALLKCVRLGQVPALSDAQPIIDRCIQNARLEIHAVLGTARITEILVTAYQENPSTTVEYERLRAQLLECTAFHIQAITLLPHTLLDGSAGGVQIYEEEAPFRLSSPDERDDTLDELKEQFRKIADDLTASDAADGVRATVVGGTCPTDGSVGAPLIGGSVAVGLQPAFDFDRYRFTFDRSGRYSNIGWVSSR